MIDNILIHGDYLYSLAFVTSAIQIAVHYLSTIFQIIVFPLMEAAGL